jgi:hypothetical protein
MNFEKEGTAFGPEDPVLYVGLDLGREQTIVHAGRIEDTEASLRLTLPTVMSYASVDGDRRTLLGREAYARHEEFPLVAPLEDKDPCVLFDFVRAMRLAIDPGFECQLWGVAQVDQGARPETMRVTRAVAQELFDRMQLVDGALLAVEHFDARRRENYSLCVDLGSESVRITPVRSGVAGDAHSFSGGASAIRQRFAIELRRSFPGFPASNGAVRDLHARLGRLAGAGAPSNEELGGPSVEGVAALASRSCETIVEDVVYAIERTLESATPREGKAFLRDIRVVGGLAEIPGLALRLEDAIARHFGDFARVHVPEEPAQAAAAGALSWAYMLPRHEWRTPLFSFAS